MRVLFDINVILDVLLEREPTFRDSYQSIYYAFDHGDLLYLSGSSVADIYYVLRKALKDKQIAKDKLKTFLRLFNIAKVNQKAIDKAFSLSGKDFEDDIILSVAYENKIDILVTNNKEDFSKGSMLVWLPKDFVEKRESKK